MVTTRSLVALALIAAALNFVTNADALGGPRVFLSAATGSDTNPSCTQTAPCRNLPRGLAVVTPGGQIVLMDTGGYAGGMNMTLTSAVQIVAANGAQATLIDNSTNYGGAALITVAAGATDLVLLRGVQIDGVTRSGTGILHHSGRLVIENCLFTQLGLGVSEVNAKMDIIDSTFTGNVVAVAASGAGTESNGSTTTSTAQLRLARGSIVGNDVAMQMTDPGEGFANIFVMISNNSASNWTTNVVGNTSALSGIGVGCSSTCSVGSYYGSGYLH
jgi:hypothetical protein